MLISEQSDLVKALLATAGITAATEFDIHAGWLIVDGVPHRVYADPIGPPAADPIGPPAADPAAAPGGPDPTDPPPAGDTENEPPQ